jgi:hypothetical protein
LPRSQHLLAHWRVLQTVGRASMWSTGRHYPRGRARSFGWQARTRWTMQGDASRGTASNPNRPVHPPQTTTRGPPRGANQATCRCCPLGTSKKQKCCRIVSSKRGRPQPRDRRPNAQLQWTRSSRRPFSWVLGRKRHLLPGNRGGARVASEHAAG